MEPLRHECGVAMIRLRKPLHYYQEKYGTWQYGLNKLYLLMEKQHNRGQEGAGMACVKMHAAAGEEYMFRERALGSGAITEIFDKAHGDFDPLQLPLQRGSAKKTPSTIQSGESLSGEGQTAVDEAVLRIPWAGELYMGHLRYSTTGKSGLQYVHPFLRRNNWRARNLCLCGNFNMTNVDDIFRELTSVGQHPRVLADTYILLEQMGHRLDRESERCYAEAAAKGLRGAAITEYIEQHINLANVLRESSRLWDGGYVICGVTGSGEMFSMRDPWGIRPAFYYADEEVVVLASERPVIQTAFDLPIEAVQELKPGEALLINQAGEVRTEQIIAAKENQACAFERIYFSRGSDATIYKERKMLGAQLLPNILRAVDGDVQHTVFSFIPNTAEVAFYGMTEAFDYYMREHDIPGIVRREKVAWKDIKLRTFITESNSRNDLAAHVYDITYGSLVPKEDYLVVIDDSIVRGTTLRESIIRILDRLQPKKMVLVSSAPQIRYPDYYGIDMARMSEFIAFKAAIALLHERGMEERIDEVYRQCAAQQGLPAEQMKNYVKEIYAPFTDEEISRKMVELLKAPEVTTDIEIVFQTVEGLHTACPDHPGDWYFSGDYPTPGGVKRLNTAYMEWYETACK
ncbi:MAG: amidophosphoribosyltransferase [Paludibacteraceae bacterium]